MADDDEELPEGPGTYTLFTDAGEKNSSIGFSGHAKAAYPNGDVYEGSFQEGVRQGHGVYTYRNGDQFEGTFDNNIKAGLGRVTYKKGGFFQGHFSDGKRHGQGTFKHANGDIFAGEWRAGKKHGKGTYVFEKTKYEFTGEWKDGRIVRGQWSLTDGSKFVGAFQHQKPSGDGCWVTSTGNVVEGTYLQQLVQSGTDGDPEDPRVVSARVHWKTAALPVTLPWAPGTPLRVSGRLPRPKPAEEPPPADDA